MSCDLHKACKFKQLICFPRNLSDDIMMENTTDWMNQTRSENETNSLQYLFYNVVLLKKKEIIDSIYFLNFLKAALQAIAVDIFIIHFCNNKSVVHTYKM